MSGQNKNIVATFTVDKKEHEVIECSFGFTQNYDSSNTPSGFPSINIINLVIKVTGDTSLVDWMVSNTAEKAGEINIKLSESKSRKIKFTQGYCVSYNERFDNYSGSSFLLNLSILLRDITVEGDGSVQYKADWEAV